MSGGRKILVLVLIKTVLKFLNYTVREPRGYDVPSFQDEVEQFGIISIEKSLVGRRAVYTIVDSHHQYTIGHFYTPDDLRVRGQKLHFWENYVGTPLVYFPDTDGNFSREFFDGTEIRREFYASPHDMPCCLQVDIITGVVDYWQWPEEASAEWRRDFGK